MKVTIIGAGGQGGACASILAGQDAVEQIRLLDLKAETAEGISAQINSEKISAGTVDATDSVAVAAAADGTDVLIDMVMPWMVPSVMRGALAAKVNYINTAFDVPYWGELLEGRKPTELTLSKEFHEAGLTALFGCGYAPGFTNIIARRLANRLDSVKEIKMRIGKAYIIPGEGPYDWILRPWNPGWSPKQALLDCASATYALEDGSFVKYEPFSGIEMCRFPDPIGELPVTHHSHEEVYSMPATFKGVKNVNFKYYMMIQPAIFYAMGLCSQNEIEAGGVRVKPIDVVSALIPPPAAHIFDTSDEQLAYADKTSFIELIVEVTGEAAGKKCVWRANCPNMNMPGPALKALYGTALVYVALPLAIGALTLGDTALEKGILFADQLDPEAFLRRMTDTGYPYRWTEVKESK
jgi:saccharopine dehydrogenase-like NADP-dependent oxidoreductase